MSQPCPVLLICDNPLMSSLLQQRLQAAGLASMCCSSSAWHELPEQIFSGVLIELVLAQPNGFTLLRKLAVRLRCPLVLLTATGRQSDFGWGRNAGATAVLSYPPELKLLQQAFNGGQQA